MKLSISLTRNRNYSYDVGINKDTMIDLEVLTSYLVQWFQTPIFHQTQKRNKEA